MTEQTKNDTNKALSFQFRLEPGCLGPEGSKHIERFCRFAQQGFEKINRGFVLYEITPRFDKTLPEIQYKINGKHIKHKQAAKYFTYKQKDIAQFEENFDNQLSLLIERYFAR